MLKYRITNLFSSSWPNRHGLPAQSLRLSLFCFFSVILAPNFAQVVFNDKGEPEPIEKLFNMYDKAHEIVLARTDSSIHVKRFDIFEIKGKTYLLPDGLFDVYEWQENNWHNLYHGIYLGYNFGSKKFVANDIIYSYAGYGYWNTHGQVIHFDRDLKEWELIDHTKDLKQGIAYLNADQTKLRLYTTDSTYTIFLTENAIIEKNGSSDLHAPMISPIFNNSSSIELDSFILVQYGKSTKALIDKRNHHVFIEPKDPEKTLKTINIESLVVLRNNDIIVYDPKTKAKRILPESDLIAHFGWNPNPPHDSNTNWIIILSLSSLIVLLGLSILFFKAIKRKILKSSTEDNSNDLSIIKTLLPYSGQKISIETLDELLLIKDIVNSETQRHRRAALIKSINQSFQLKHGQPLIERIQDPTDGRKYLYHISRKHK